MDNRLPSLALCAAGLLFASAAPAETYQLDFTASNYLSLFEGPDAPATSIAGWFRFEAAALDAPIDFVTAVGLTIDGKTYGPNDIAGEFAFGAYLFGESLTSAINVVMAPSDDFLFQFDSSPGGSLSYYANAASDGVWYTGDIVYSIAAVPEPAPALMLLGGLAGMAAAGRVLRRRRG